MTKPVVLSNDAIADLDSMFEWIADTANDSIAQAYIDRLKSYCLSFALFPERGTLRPGIRAGVCTIGLRRQVAIAFSVREDDVLILRIARGGRNIETLLNPEQD